MKTEKSTGDIENEPRLDEPPTKTSNMGQQITSQRKFDRAQALPPFFFLCVCFSSVFFMMRMATQRRKCSSIESRKMSASTFYDKLYVSLLFNLVVKHSGSVHMPLEQNVSWSRKETESDTKKQRNNCNSASCNADCTARRTISSTAGWFQSLIKTRTGNYRSTRVALYWWGYPTSYLSHISLFRMRVVETRKHFL